MRRIISAAVAALLLAGCAATPDVERAPLAPSARYVAMGSSFAAGPSVTVSADSPATRCNRSRDNYARQLARLRQFDLVDVSCGGATSAHLLGPWNELAPQIDALTADTALVTITIGGNDVGYVGRLFMASCKGGADLPASAAAMCKGMAARQQAGGASASLPAIPTEAAWATLAGSLDRATSEVRRRAPRARLIFVDYVTLLPSGALCPQVPLNANDAASARATARRLAQETAAAAKRAEAQTLRVSVLSQGHDACAAQPWANGFIAREGVDPFTPYHPNLAGMTAIATALDRMLGR